MNVDVDEMKWVWRNGLVVVVREEKCDLPVLVWNRKVDAVCGWGGIRELWL